MHNGTPLESWAQAMIHCELDSAGDALESYCKKPRSAKRLHSTRKALARLKAALQDLGAIAGVAPAFIERVNELHRRAGKVRDADVLLNRLNEYAASAFGEESQQLECLEGVLRRKRKRQRRKLQATVSSIAPELHA